MRVKPTTVILMALSLFAFAPPASAARQYAWMHGWDASGRPFDLRSLRGQIVALTFASKDTRDEATEVNDELTKLVVPGRVALVSVIDLANVPQYAYGTARKRIRELEQPGVVRVVDERGELSRAYQVEPRKQVDIFVIGRDGEILGHFVGSTGADEAIKLLQHMQ